MHASLQFSRVSHDGLRIHNKLVIISLPDTCVVHVADSLMRQYGGAFALLQNMGRGPSSEKSHSSQVGL